MAYIPDEWVMKRLPIPETSRDILFYYCGRANHDTGLTNVSAQRVSQDLGIRKDHIDEHDRRLIRLGYVQITKDQDGGRVIRLLEPWEPVEKRKRKAPQRIDEPDTSQDLGKTPQNLGNKIKEFPRVGKPLPQNLGKVTQNLGLHIRNNQPINQPIREPIMSDAPASCVSAGQVREVFAYWQFRTGHQQAKLTDGREKKIRARLKEGYTVAQVKLGVDGCKASPFHQGQNDQGAIHDDIELICRSGEKLEKFIQLAEGNGNGKGNHGPKPIPRNETHNERAARETFEWIEASVAATVSDSAFDPEDANQAGLTIDIGR